MQNRVSNVIAQLPTAVQQQGLKYEQTSTGFLLVVTVSSTDGSLDQTALADYIARNIQNPISRVPGVGQFSCSRRRAPCASGSIPPSWSVST